MAFVNREHLVLAAINAAESGDWIDWDHEMLQMFPNWQDMRAHLRSYYGYLTANSPAFREALGNHIVGYR